MLDSDENATLRCSMVMEENYIKYREGVIGKGLCTSDLEMDFLKDICYYVMHDIIC